MADAPSIHPGTGRLRVADVKRIHDAVGGDPVTEELILRFIADKYGARNLLHLTPRVAAEILRRPVEFLRAAKRHGEPQLSF